MPSTDTPLVMIWRQVPDLPSAKSFVEGMFSVVLMGQDDDSLMYDASTIILGLFGQNEFWKKQAEEQSTLAAASPVDRHNAARLALAGQCSGLNFAKVDLVVNPAIKLGFATDDLQMPRARLREDGVDTRLATASTRFGDSLPFYDTAGNLYSVTQFSNQAMTTATGFVGPRLATLLAGAEPQKQRFTNIDLMTSDIARSQSFYTDVLGLRHLPGLENTITFDLGTCLLNLLPESTPRMVQALSKTGRLHGDWFVLHTTNITDKVNRLTRLGVKFPQGIEESATGRMAFFNDPDGYALALWQPIADETLPMKKINFFPVLNRILKTVAATP